MRVLSLRAACEGEIRYFLFAMDAIDGSKLSPCEAVFNEARARLRVAQADDACERRVSIC